eukprot:m.59389 g.59389  ORF g.59389 m.59389 type:complete len:69 (-) comp11318_c0_seq1:2694-2900(-)
MNAVNERDGVFNLFLFNCEFCAEQRGTKTKLIHFKTTSCIRERKTCFTNNNNNAISTKIPIVWPINAN